METRISLILALSMCTTTLVAAQDQQNVSAGMTAAGAPLAIHGYDPVAYFNVGQPTVGSAKFTSKHDHAAYRFASEANLKAFEKDPAAYLPQFGGFCAFGVTVEKKFDGDPRVFEVVDGKLYFNLNPDIQALWSKDIPGNIQKAGTIWKEIRAMDAHNGLDNDELNVNSSLTGINAPLALHGYDPVAYFSIGLPTMGAAKFSAQHGNAAYRFASEANKQAFEKNPGAYLPQFGGFCAYGASVGKKFDGDPRIFALVDGKLFLNLNPEIQKLWEMDVPSNIRKAQGQWSKIRSKSAEELLAQ